MESRKQDLLLSNGLTRAEPCLHLHNLLNEIISGYLSVYYFHTSQVLVFKPLLSQVLSRSSVKSISVSFFVIVVACNSQ